MLFIWLFVWLVNDTPQLEAWNAWLVALIVCGVMDLGGSGKALS